MKIKKILKICSGTVSLGAIAMAGTCFYWPTTTAQEIVATTSNAITADETSSHYTIDYFKPSYDSGLSQYLDENGWIKLGDEKIPGDIESRTGPSYKQVFLSENIANAVIVQVKIGNPTVGNIGINTPVIQSDLEVITELNLSSVLNNSKEGFTSQELLVALFGNPNVQHWTKLANIDLSSNALWNLPANIFAGVMSTSTNENLIISLVNNNLTYITGDEFGIKSDAVKGLGLDLSLNNITRIDGGDIKTSIQKNIEAVTADVNMGETPQSDIINLKKSQSGKSSGDVYNMITNNGKNINIWPEEISKDKIIKELNDSERCSKVVTADDLTITASNMVGNFNLNIAFPEGTSWVGGNAPTYSETLYFNALYIGLAVDCVFLVLTAIGLYFAISGQFKKTKKVRKTKK